MKWCDNTDLLINKKVMMYQTGGGPSVYCNIGSSDRRKLFASIQL